MAHSITPRNWKTSIERDRDMVRLVRLGGADVRVRDLALRAAAARPDVPLANAIHDAQRRSIRWVPEWGEVLEGHAYTLSRRAADCDGQAILLAAQFLAVGLAPVELVFLGLPGRASTHVAVRCRGAIYDTAPDLDRSMVVQSSIACSWPRDPYIPAAESDRALQPLGRACDWIPAGCKIQDGAESLWEAGTDAVSDAWEWIGDRGEDLWSAIKAAGGVIGSAADRLLEVVALPFDALQGAILKIPGVAALVARAKQVLGKLQSVVRRGLAAVVGDKLADLACAAFAEMIACAAGPGSACQQAVKRLAGKAVKFATDVVVAVATDPMFWVQIAAIAVSCVAPPACAAAAAIVAKEYAIKAVLKEIQIPPALQGIAPSALVGALNAVGRGDIGALVTQGVTAAKAEAERQIKNLPQRFTKAAINAAIGQAPAFSRPYLEAAAKNGIDMQPEALGNRARLAMLAASTSPKFTSGFLDASRNDLLNALPIGLDESPLYHAFADNEVAAQCFKIARIDFPLPIERAALSPLAAAYVKRGMELATAEPAGQVNRKLTEFITNAVDASWGRAAHIPFTVAEKNALYNAAKSPELRQFTQNRPRFAKSNSGSGGLVFAGLAAAAVAVVVLK